MNLEAVFDVGLLLKLQRLSSRHLPLLGLDLVDVPLKHFLLLVLMTVRLGHLLEAGSVINIWDVIFRERQRAR